MVQHIVSRLNAAPYFRTVLFSSTLFLSAALMFIVQLIIGKMMLPMVGGSPNGWLVAMSYFQIALLAGYGLAHVLTRFTPFVHMSVVAGVLLLGFVSLPLHLGGGLAEKLSPIAGDVFFSLLVSLTIPFLGLSMMSPSLQRLFASSSSESARDPYFLFAASNLGSFIGLLSYPLLIERISGLSAQSHGWQVGYIALIILCGLCLLLARNDAKARQLQPEKLIAVEWRTAFYWIALAFIPSSLTLGVTSQITMDGGAIPFFWVLPLAIYLLTFVLAFSRFRIINMNVAAFAQPMGLVLLIFTFAQQPLMIAWNLQDLLPQIIAFCVVVLFCHFQLADSRPQASKLTSYYLYIALGGALGGFFNVFIAPLIFPLPFEFILIAFASCLVSPPRQWAEPYEVRLGVLIAVILAFLSFLGILILGGEDRALTRISPWSQSLFVGALGFWVYCQSEKGRAFKNKPMIYVILLGLFVAVIGLELIDKNKSLNQFYYMSAGVVLLFSLFIVALHPRFLLVTSVLLGVFALAFSNAPSLLAVDRNFFGILHIRDIKYTDNSVARYFNNGSTIHGIQKVLPRIDTRPTSYYTPKGPLGDIMNIVQPKDVGMVGMGAGTTVCYMAPKRHFTVYDINPDVPKLASKWFYYFSSCGTPEIKIGDGRKLLEAAKGIQHDVLVVDAFSSDAIPVHLMTKEAVKTYFDRLSPKGVLALHLTNRYYELVPPAVAIADALGFVSLYKIHNVQPADAPDSTSVWVVLMRTNGPVKKFKEQGWQFTPKGQYVWTDDFSHPLSALSTISILRELGYAQEN